MRLSDPKVRDGAESPRLSGQCQDILRILQRGPATNHELSAWALKYTSRISDLRANGFNIVVKSRDHKSGLVVYELLPEPIFSEKHAIALPPRSLFED